MKLVTALCGTGNRPLWEGTGYREEGRCYNSNSPPWFYKKLNAPIADDIEMRVCRNEASSDEDIAIELVEIYVQ